MRVLMQNARPVAPQLLHVPTDAEHKAEVHAERADVRARLARDPEHAQVALRVELEQLALVDGAHTQLALHRGDERRALEERTCKRADRLSELRLALDRLMQPHDGDVFLARVLLRLYEAGRAVDADNQAARHLRVQRAAVPCLLDAQDALEPGDDLVRRGVRRLVEVDDAVLEVVAQWPHERRVPTGNRCVVARARVQVAVVLEQQRPAGRVDGRRVRLGLDQPHAGITRRGITLDGLLLPHFPLLPPNTSPVMISTLTWRAT
mmetsp:Transcript_13087/g.33250  ORF Transcript_13087/g.33250 Transcript_13087/m.33250 type:complete len:264 (+) Transcript_13087:848-1639(+)